MHFCRIYVKEKVNLDQEKTKYCSLSRDNLIDNNQNYLVVIRISFAGIFTDKILSKI